MASLSFCVSATTTSSSLHLPSKKSSSSSSSSSTPTWRFYTHCKNRNSSGSKSRTANTTNIRDDCNSTRSTEKSESGSCLRLDRRNVLLGLGGLYGGSTLTGHGNMAIAAPVEPPDLSKCHDADGGPGVGKVNCCPPYTSGTPKKYQFPPKWKPLRVRKPAHLLETDEIDKYKEAVAMLRNLAEDDPRGWMQQANVHCLYCNGAYDQVGFPKVPLEVHDSWLFLPWHRWYLHFHERILGNLIGDDSFALPFWNWDTPEGMHMPPIFANKTSSLYDAKRNLCHLPPAILDLGYKHGDPVPTPCQRWEVEERNLVVIGSCYKKENLLLPRLFMGHPLKAGKMPDHSPGGLERIHNTIHDWTGCDSLPYEDMGNLFSAARDPIFFSHHSNVDRMWQIYRCMRGYRTEFLNLDWLDASFVFVDENKVLVRVKIADSLNPLRLKYTYDNVRDPWAETGPRKRLIKLKAKAKAKAKDDAPLVSEFGSEPRALTSSTIRVRVKRPKQSRSKAEKEEAVEALVISGIQAPISQPSRFDVYLTIPDGPYPEEQYLAGSFVKLSHHGTNALKLELGITTLLEDLEAESAEKLEVSLVPRLGDFTIGGVSIDLLKTQGPED